MATVIAGLGSASAMTVIPATHVNNATLPTLTLVACAIRKDHAQTIVRMQESAIISLVIASVRHTERETIAQCQNVHPFTSFVRNAMTTDA